MESISEHRDEIRRKHKANILLETHPAGNYYEARMFNYSIGGMYFESDYAPLPGTEIYIGIENSPYDAGADVYRAQVRWRKELLDVKSKYNYGVGVKYSQPIHSQL
ncbi:MAG: PilZ domain-containing protein [Desulfobacterales bacterium]|nr:MAG: PilZ domain-containing protein [Desulfobacterales bacterium]